MNKNTTKTKKTYSHADLENAVVEKIKKEYSGLPEEHIMRLAKLLTESDQNGMFQ